MFTIDAALALMDCYEAMGLVTVDPARVAPEMRERREIAEVVGEAHYHGWGNCLACRAEQAR